MTILTKAQDEAIYHTMSIETLTKAEQCAALLVADLQEALTQNSATASLLILPMVQRAAAIKDEIAALRQAAAIDATEATEAKAESARDQLPKIGPISVPNYKKEITS